MGLLKRLFTGMRPETASSSVPHSQLASGVSQSPGQTQNGNRREMLRVVLRDTLNKHGIPSAWIAAEVLGTTSSRGLRGIHWRLVVKHWDPRLLTHGVALQQALIKRLTSFDPLASEWLTGISWQFALADESACPPLPNASVWTAQEPQPQSHVASVPKKASPTVERLAQGDVIAGPAYSPEPQDADAAKADLEALMAIRDADFRAHGESQGTQPMWLRTEPAPLN
jgi:hypothetical protein